MEDLTQDSPQISLETLGETSPELRETAPPPIPPKFDVTRKAEETLRHEVQLKNKVETLDRFVRNDSKERELLVERVRQAEERNSALNGQFNELYHYCESLYQDSEKRRKETERRALDSEERTRKLEQELEKAASFRADLEDRIAEIQSRADELSGALQKKREERMGSLNSLLRGKECIESAVQTLAGFQTSFQAYLESIERNGFTPVSQRTAKLFIEHWNVERTNLARVSTLLSELLESSRDTHAGG